MEKNTDNIYIHKDQPVTGSANSMPSDFTYYYDNNKVNYIPVDAAEFKANRINQIRRIYSDEISAARKRDYVYAYSARSGIPKTAKDVRELLNDTTKRNHIVDFSNKLYATNPIYAMIIEYLSNMFLWRYKVVPHKVFSQLIGSKRKPSVKEEKVEFERAYNLMLELVEGLNIPTNFPALLTTLFINGAVYLATVSDKNSYTVETVLLPDRFCRKVAQTQYGTSIIEFNFSYFDRLRLSKEDIDNYLKEFPEEFSRLYNEYKEDSTKPWKQLDPRFSTGILLNDISIPTLFYLYGGLLDYEKYQDNELQRNQNLLKYLVIQKMPIYQDRLVFEVDEVEALHKTLAQVVNTNENARLLTSFGDIDVKRITENDTVANEVLQKAFKSIFHNAGLNSGLFTGDSVEVLKMSLVRDKARVWKYVEQFLSFYNLAINNWYDFGMYEADIDILPISLYTYNDDMEAYKENATLGVGKLDYFIASGMKQKTIQDQLKLEKFLKLDKITPMQTSYTQTAEDRSKKGVKKTDEIESKEEDLKSGIEPTDKESKT